MSGRTDNFGFSTMGPGDALSEDGYKYTGADRKLMDLLMRRALSHSHNGSAGAAAEAPGAPTLAVLTTGGGIAASRRVYYKLTIVDVNGLESLPSSEAFIDTAAQIAEPSAPTLTAFSSGGSLLSGSYNYVLSAYVGTTTNETKAVTPAYVTVPIGTSTNRVLITFPSLPAGATGWNVYRKKPGGVRFDFLAAVTGASPTWADTGAIEEDCNRTTPTKNSTNASNQITVVLEDALDPGQTWRIYRTYVSGSYNNSLAHHVVEETFEGSGLITDTYYDTGAATMVGSPPSSGQTVTSPEQVLLTDGEEVRGKLPLALVSAFPHEVVFTEDGVLDAPLTGKKVWVCEFPRATILGCRAYLGRGYAPASTTVVADVNVGSGATPTPVSIFTASGDQPRILVGDQIGDRVVPTARATIFEGDSLTVDWDVDGGGATPTDRYATLSVYMLVHGYTEELSFFPDVDAFLPQALAAWHKADALGLSNGASVSSFTDSSGNGRHATQATGGARPTFVTGVINSLAAVAFDGIDDFLKTAAFTLDQPVTLFLVGQDTETVATRMFFDGVTTGAARFGIGGGSYLLSAGGLALAAGADSAWHIYTVVYDGASSQFMVGGGPSVITDDVGADSPGGITFGSNGGGNAQFLQGYIAESMVYEGVLSAEDQNIVGHYLAEKYALGWDDVEG